MVNTFQFTRLTRLILAHRRDTKEKTEIVGTEIGGQRSEVEKVNA